MRKYFPGIKDEDFLRGDVPMTKKEIRVLALSQARISEQDTIIDIGAGTGSISIEAAIKASQGKIYAIEKEAKGIDLIKANAQKFGVNNIEIIHGTAPAALVALPSVDVVFLGGSGGYLEDIICRSDTWVKVGGRLVVTAVTVETLGKTMELLQKKPNYEVEAYGVQITRIRPVGTYNMFQALNQVYIITGTRIS